MAIPTRRQYGIDHAMASASLRGMIEQTKQKSSLTLTSFEPIGGLNRGATNLKSKFLTMSVGLFMLLRLGSVYAAAPMPADGQFNVSLNGPWRFKLEQENGKSKRPAAYGQKYPLELPATFEVFYGTDYVENASWHDLKVPGNWEIAGYSPATYYQPDNASGFYRKRFVVPESWQGRLVKVNFDGVQNGAEIWLNGQPVKAGEPSWGRDNYHESGWTAWQADLTPMVKFGQENLLALRVNKNTRSVDLDRGDYFFLGGVYRPVTLFSVPQTHIEDFSVRTRLLDDGRAEVKTLVTVTGEAPDQAKVSVRLEGENVVSGTADAQGSVELSQIVSHPRLWSAEFPNLYAMEIALADSAGHSTERLSRQIGIREVTVTNGLLLVNGTRVKLTGICRHDVSATDGTAVGEALWTKDLTLMKAANINAIRCSHYPYGSGFYDLCDKMGFYVLGELPYCWVGPPTMIENCPGDDPAMTPAFEQRARETVLRDKNHPSIIVWGIGNENYGRTVLKNLQRAADLARQLDPTRPRLVSGCLADKYHVEMDDTHYPTLKMMTNDINNQTRRAKWPMMYSEHPNVYDVRRGADYGALDLWTAVMTRTWALIWDCDSIPGSFLWEWQDRAVADKCKTKLYDFDPATGVSYVKNKGLVDGWRNPRPDYYAVKMEYSPIKMGREADMVSKPGSAVLSITNRYSFTDLSDLDVKWRLLRNGISVADGAAKLKLAPLSSGREEIPLPADALRKSPDTLRLEFDDPRGWNIVTSQFDLVKPKPFSIKGTPLPRDLPFPRLNLIGEAQISDPMKHLPTERFDSFLRNVKVEPSESTSLALGRVKSMEADILLRTDPPQIVGRVRAHFAKGVFGYHIDWTGPDTWIQELGWIFEMPNAYDRFSWQRQAVWSYYPDTNIGRPAGTALPDSANAHVTKIDRPDAFDFNSSKYNCYWASLTDDSGRGLCVQFAPEDHYAVRGGFGGDGSYTLVVNKQASPPRENNIVPDFFLQLKKGDTVDGSFLVGSRK
jgi:beta-galactosidase